MDNTPNRNLHAALEQAAITPGTAAIFVANQTNDRQDNQPHHPPPQHLLDSRAQYIAPGGPTMQAPPPAAWMAQHTMYQPPGLVPPTPTTTTTTLNFGLAAPLHSTLALGAAMILQHVAMGNAPATAVQNINTLGRSVQGHEHIAPHPSVTTATEGATAAVATATTTATKGATVQQGFHNTQPLLPHQQMPVEIPAAVPLLPTEDPQHSPTETGNRYGLQAALERQAATLTPERYKTELAWQSDVNAEKQKEDKLKEDVLMGQDTLRHDNFNFQSHTSYIE